MFQVRPFETKTLSWWHSEKSNVDLAPVYQRRGHIWTAADKAFLIDSILNQYDVPKIYIADFTYTNTKLNKHNLPYAVIDGKQRFEAIYNFFDGNVVLAQDFIWTEEPALQLGGLSYKDLQASYPKVASKFANFNLTVMSVITDEEGKINDLFIRLNRSKPLTGAEMRNAMQGEVPPLIRKLVDHDVFKTRIKFTVARGQDKGAAAKLLLLEFRGKFVDTKKVQLDRFVKEATGSQASDLQSAAQQVESTLNSMALVFVPKDALLSSQGPVTLYYWFIRAHGSKHLGVIRDFLVKFSRERQENQRKVANAADGIDTELSRFDLLNRSPNDQGSLTGRYQILEKRFVAYLKTAPAH